MHIYADDKIREINQAFKALSDETRLRILSLLLDRECCVCEVMQALEISQSKASRGLNTLYNAGFLKMRKDGLWSYYSLAKEHLPRYLAMVVAAVVEALQDNPLIKQDRKRLQRSRRIGPGLVAKMYGEGVTKPKGEVAGK